jgi:thiol-disulfide isomerase/thioredoxin
LGVRLLDTASAFWKMAVIQKIQSGVEPPRFQTEERPMRPTWRVFVAFWLGGLSLGAICQSELRAEPAPPFPSDPAAWVNSGPLTVSGLKGKGVVLWFFEETCPRCRERWPALLESAKSFEGKPVIFIAVNSGTNRQTVEKYVRDVKCPWPVIVDSSRAFEKACGIENEISLQNIIQAKYITSTGDLQSGSFSDFEGTAAKALDNAAWKIDPTDVPDALKPIWQNIEIGNYKGLALSLKKSLASPRADVKEASQKLLAVAQQELDELIAQAKQAQADGHGWRAYELSNQIAERFAGFELPMDVAELKKTLQKDARVKAGLAALKSLDLSKKLLQGSSPAVRKKGEELLQKVIDEFPDTELAKQAQSLLDQVQPKAATNE